MYCRAAPAAGASPSPGGGSDALLARLEAIKSRAHTLLGEAAPSPPAQLNFDAAASPPGAALPPRPPRPSLPFAATVGL